MDVIWVVWGLEFKCSNVFSAGQESLGVCRFACLRVYMFKCFAGGQEILRVCRCACVQGVQGQIALWEQQVSHVAILFILHILFSTELLLLRNPTYNYIYRGIQHTITKCFILCHRHISTGLTQCRNMYQGYSPRPALRKASLAPPRRNWQSLRGATAQSWPQIPRF